MININFQGQMELKKKIELAYKKYPEATKKGIKLSCILVEGRAKYYVPVDTGRLKSSITYEVKENFWEINGYVGTDVEYAPYLEFGTKKMPSYPFLLPALYDSKANIMKIFEDVLNNVKL